MALKQLESRQYRYCFKVSNHRAKAFEFSTTNDDVINADTEDETYDVAVDEKNVLSNEDDVKSDEVLTDKNSLKDKASNLKEPVANTEIDELVTDDNNVVAKDNEN